MHFVSYLSNLTLNVTALIMIAQTDNIGEPWYKYDNSAGTLAIIYCIKTSIMMLFYLIRFYVFSRNEWQQHLEFEAVW